MTRIQCQMQVINDDKSWIQLQRLSPSEVGDHAMTVLTGCFLGKCRVFKKIQMANAVPRNWHTKSVLDAWRRLLLGRLYVIKSNIKENFTLQKLWVHPSPPGGCWVIIKLPCVLMATTSHEDPVRKAACRCEINFNSLLSQVLSWESWPKWDLNCFLLVNLYHP